MRNPSSAGIGIELDGRSGSREPALSAGIDAKQLLYFLLLIPAAVLGLMPLGVYRPLDTRLPLAAIIGAFVLSAVLRLRRIAQRRPSGGGDSWHVVSACAGLALPFLGLLLFLNGALDRTPGNYVRATVISKTAPIEFREAQYGLRVSSWRPGRSVEELNAGSREFARAAVGKDVIITIHRGYFSMPWYSNITPE